MKMKAGFSLDEITIKRIEVLAEGTRREKSTIVDIAIELLSQQDEFADLELPTPPRKTATRGSKTSKAIATPDRIPGLKRGVQQLALEVAA